MNLSQPPPDLPQGASVDPTTSNLAGMNASAATNASQTTGAVVECAKKTSWFAIRIVGDNDAVVEGLALKLKLTEVGDSERITSKAVDPIKIEGLTPGGKGDVQYIDAGELVWEAVGEIT